MLDVLPERERIDVSLAIRRVVEFDLRNLRLKLAIGDEVKIVALRVPRGIVSVEHVVGDFARLAVGGAPDPDGGEAVRVFVVTESQIVAARRPGVVTHLTMRRVGNLNHLLIGERDDVDLSVLVRKSDALAVGRPLRLVTHGAAAAGDLLGGFQSVLRTDVQLLFAAHVGDESDAGAVG